MSAATVIEVGVIEVSDGEGGMEGREWSWGTLSPKPPGIYRFLAAPAEENGGPGDPPGWWKIARRFLLLLLAGSGRRSGRIPALPYPPPEQRARDFTMAPKVFPVSVSLGVPRVGNGESGPRGAGFEAEAKLVTAGRADDQAQAGEFGQGVAERGRAHGAELAQLLHRDGAILTGQRFPNPVRGRGRSALAGVTEVAPRTERARAGPFCVNWTAKGSAEGRRGVRWSG
jgi:hypothetical protein